MHFQQFNNSTGLHNQNLVSVMRIKYLVFNTIFFVLLEGCSAFTMPVKPPGVMADTAQLDSLIGQNRQVAYEKLGLPIEEYSKNGTHYLLYAAKTDAYGVLFFFYVPMWASKFENSAIHCLRVDVDSENIIKAYKVRSGGQREFMFIVKYPSCKAIFWSDKELQAIQRESVIHFVKNPSVYLAKLSLNDDDNITDPEKQYELYMLGVENRLEWLCKSAVQKYPPALREIGDIFYFGWYSKAINYQRAYLWYRDAIRHGVINNYHDTEAELREFKAHAKLTKTQITEALQQEAKWTDAQCAKDLLTQNTEQTAD